MKFEKKKLYGMFMFLVKSVLYPSPIFLKISLKKTDLIIVIKLENFITQKLLFGNTQFFHRVKFDYANYQIHCYFPIISHVLEIIPERDFNDTERD